MVVKSSWRSGVPSDGAASDQCTAQSRRSRMAKDAEEVE